MNIKSGLIAGVIIILLAVSRLIAGLAWAG